VGVAGRSEENGVNDIIPFVYLASPYSHPDPAVRQQRFEAVCKVAFELMSTGIRVFCPIAHSHPIDIASGVMGSWAFWQYQDAPFLLLCSQLLVLTLPGWKESTGVAYEIKVASARGIPIDYIPA
jgi:hypothetical protein